MPGLACPRVSLAGRHNLGDRSFPAGCCITSPLGIASVATGRESAAQGLTKVLRVFQPRHQTQMTLT